MSGCRLLCAIQPSALPSTDPLFMYRRLKNKLNRERRRSRRRSVPLQPDNTFSAGGGIAWYEPVLAGPATFARDCSGEAALTGVIPILEQLAADDYLNFTLRFYQAGLKQYGARWHYADITTVLYGVCCNLRVESYLEVGVRRGRSLAVVGALCPTAHLVGFDMWIPDYGAAENPGPAFVQQELARVGHRGKLELVSGNSRTTVPDFFRRNTSIYFDLITIDGDHSARGARMDLEHAIPRLKVGGVLVFDDICNPDHRYLRDVWTRVVAGGDRFLTTVFEEPGYGVALAVKKW